MRLPASIRLTGFPLACVVQSLRAVVLAPNVDVLEVLQPGSKDHFAVNPLRQSTHLQNLQGLLCGALLQLSADWGEVGDSDRSFIAGMPTAHGYTTQPEETTKVQVLPPLALLSALVVFYNIDPVEPFSVLTRVKNG